MTALPERRAAPFEPVRELRVMHGCTGHLASSRYADVFWTPLLGPTASLLWRRLVERGDGQVDVAALARELGVVKPHLWRNAVNRLGRFGIVALTTSQVWVRDAVPTLTPKALDQLPGPLRARHRELYE